MKITLLLLISMSITANTWFLLTSLTIETAQAFFKKPFRIFRSYYQRRVVQNQWPDALIFLAGALKSGLSIEEAIRTLANEAPDPLRSELQGSVIDYHLWSSVSVRLDRLLRGPDLALARAALLLSKETGGKVSVVVEKAAVILNKKKDLNQKLKTLTAQGKASAWIVGLSPVGLLLMFLLLSPDFVAPLFKTGLGLKVLGLALTMLITGLFFVQRVCRLE